MAGHSTKGLLAELTAYLQRGKFDSIFDRFLAEYLLWYIGREHREGRLPNYDMTSVLHYVPLLIDDAFERLCQDRSEEIAAFREQYAKIDLHGHNPPDLVEIAFGGTSRALMVSHLGYLMEKVTGQGWVKAQIESHFFAQDQVLGQVAHQFVRKVYRTGLRHLTVESNCATYSGTFGTTTLRSFESAGRILFTFARKNRSNPTGEDSVTLIGEASEEPGMRFGIQSVHADLFTACGLIKDVIAHWPNTEEKQKRLIRRDEKVSLF